MRELVFCQHAAASCHAPPPARAWARAPAGWAFCSDTSLECSQRGWGLHKEWRHRASARWQTPLLGNPLLVWKCRHNGLSSWRRTPARSGAFARQERRRAWVQRQQQNLPQQRSKLLQHKAVLETVISSCKPQPSASLPDHSWARKQRQLSGGLALARHLSSAVASLFVQATFVASSAASATAATRSLAGSPGSLPLLPPLHICHAQSGGSVAPSKSCLPAVPCLVTLPAEHHADLREDPHGCAAGAPAGGSGSNRKRALVCCPRQAQLKRLP